MSDELKNAVDIEPRGTSNLVDLTAEWTTPTARPCWGPTFAEQVRRAAPLSQLKPRSSVRSTRVKLTDSRPAGGRTEGTAADSFDPSLA